MSLQVTVFSIPSDRPDEARKDKRLVAAERKAAGLPYDTRWEPLASVEAIRAELKAREAKAAAPCRCREPKRHSDCCYCGSGFEPYVCGVCRDGGIDGAVVRGTSRVICKKHAPAAGRKRVTFRF